MRYGREAWEVVLQSEGGDLCAVWALRQKAFAISSFLMRERETEKEDSNHKEAFHTISCTNKKPQQGKET